MSNLTFFFFCAKNNTIIGYALKMVLIISNTNAIVITIISKKIIIIITKHISYPKKKWRIICAAIFPEEHFVFQFMPPSQQNNHHFCSIFKSIELNPFASPFYWVNDAQMTMWLLKLNSWFYCVEIWEHFHWIFKFSN